MTKKLIIILYFGLLATRTVYGQVASGGMQATSASVFNLGGAGRTAPTIVVATVGALPATCVVGDQAFVTAAAAGSQGYKCSSTNTWTQDSGGVNPAVPANQTLSFYGAVVGSTSDQSTAIQNWINFLTSNGGGGNGLVGVCNIPGAYTVNNPITVSNISNLHLFLYGCIFTPGGAGNPMASASMFTFANVANSQADGGLILATSASTLGSCLVLTNVAGNTVAPVGDIFRDFSCNGTNGQIFSGIRGTVGSGGDNNVSEMTFINVTVSNTSDDCWSIEGTQQVNWQIIGSSGGCRGNGFNKYALSGSGGGVSQGTQGQFTWDGSFFTGQTQEDFREGPPPSALVNTIQNVGEVEGSNRFLVVDATGAATPTVVRNVFWSSNSLNADLKAMVLQSPGPFTFDNLFLGSDGTKAMTVSWAGYTVGGYPPTMTCINSAFRTSVTTTGTLFTSSIPTTAINCQIYQSGTASEPVVGQNLSYQASSFTAVTLGSPTITSVTNGGASGGTNWCYEIVGIDATGTNHSATSSPVCNASGAATLTSSNYNLIGISGTAGYVTYNIYRTTAGGTPSSVGKIPVTGSTNTGGVTSLAVKDTGLTGDTTTAPTNNTTGQFNTSIGHAGSVIAAGSLALATSSITSGTCQAVSAGVNNAAATGALTTDSIMWTPNGSIKAVTGFIPSTSGGLSIAAYPTANNVNFDVCNWEAGSVTPGAVTLNWLVLR